MNAVHFVVPDGIDDPARPSGGNVYDRRIRDGLAALGWTVRTHPVGGAWPDGDTGALAAVLGALPDDAVVLVDGLIGAAAPGVLVPVARRLRLVILVHMPLGGAGERAVLDAARAVVATSEWTRRALATTTGVHVATPGVDPARVAPGTPGGGRLLCVGAVAPHKGHDVLLAALAGLADQRFGLTCAGPQRPDFVAALRRRAAADGLADRVRFTGPLDRDDLTAAYAAADVLVSASHAETYGMVVTEALAHGLPVIATDVGGVPEALGGGGLLVPAGDPAVLRAAVRAWLADPVRRARLRVAALARRATLTGWDVTAARVAWVLAGAAAPSLAEVSR